MTSARWMSRLRWHRRALLHLISLALLAAGMGFVVWVMISGV